MTKTLRSTIFSLAVAAAASAAHGQVLAPAASDLKPSSGRTVASFNPNFLRGACVRAVENAKWGDGVGLSTQSVELMPVTNPHVAECTVTAQKFESGRTPTQVRFSASVDVSDGSTKVAEVDEAGAKMMAQLALASRFFDLKPIAESASMVSYSLKVEGKACRVDVSKVVTPLPSHWEVSGIDCKS